MRIFFVDRNRMCVVRSYRFGFGPTRKGVLQMEFISSIRMYEIQEGKRLVTAPTEWNCCTHCLPSLLLPGILPLGTDRFGLLPWVPPTLE